MTDLSSPRANARTALLAAVIVAVTGCTASYPGYSGDPSARHAAGRPFSSSSLAQDIGRQAGTRLQGLAPQTVPAGQARALSNQVPAGASVDKAANKIVFTGGSASFTVVAVPPGGPDMSFRIAGLVNPAIVVPRDARVTVEFVNADTDEAHGWLVTSEQPPFTFGQVKVPSISGAYAALIGDPADGEDGARTITFQAGPAGTYQYICPMPGHAQMGMHGTFIVR